MKIAEFFVALGVKGSDKTSNAFKNVDKSMASLKSTSLATKAAILAVVYGMQRMMMNSSQMGMGLSNFASLTGLSAKELQKWQYAARRAGVSGDELMGNVKSVQSAMANMLTTGEVPKGFGLFSETVGFDMNKARDTFYVLKKLQEFARSNVAPELGNEIIKGFGITDNMISGFRDNIFREDIFAQAPAYNDKQIQQLKKVNVAWSDLGDKVNRAFGDFTAKHGMQLISDLTTLTGQVLKLADALAIAAEKFGFFDGLSKMVENLANIMTWLTGAAEGYNEQGAAGMFQPLNAMTGKSKNSVWWLPESWNSALGYGDQIAPRKDASAKDWNKVGGQKAMTVNQNMYFQHPGENAQELGNSTQKAVRSATSQIGARAGGM